MSREMPRPIKMTPMYRCERPRGEGGHGVTLVPRCESCKPAPATPQLYSMGNDLLLDDPATHKAPETLH